LPSAWARFGSTVDDPVPFVQNQSSIHMSHIVMVWQIFIVDLEFLSETSWKVFTLNQIVFLREKVSHDTQVLQLECDNQKTAHKDLISTSFYRQLSMHFN
jgi:hypothetical protein